MPHVTLKGDTLDIDLSLIDKLLGFHGSFHVPLQHVTNAYVSSYEDLEIQHRLEGTNLGVEGTIGLFSNPRGLIFVDGNEDRDLLVVETRGERISQIAVQLPANEDPNTLAHEIMQAVPDSGPVE